jgi:hypothetical protein
MGRRSADGGSRFPPPYSARVIDLSIGAILRHFQPCLVFYIHSPVDRCLESLKTGKNRLFRFCVSWCLVWCWSVREHLPLFRPYSLPIYPPILLSSYPPGSKSNIFRNKEQQPARAWFWFHSFPSFLLWFCWSPRYWRTLPVLQVLPKIRAKKKETFLDLLFYCWFCFAQTLTSCSRLSIILVSY